LSEVRKQAHPLFDEKMAPKLREMGATDMEKAFNVWFDMELAAVKAEDLDNRINSDFRGMAKDELKKIRADSNAKLDESQKELGGSCKSDVGSQALRLTLAPVGWVAGNFEAAKNEKKHRHPSVPCTFGCHSAQAIAEHGFLGGDEPSPARRSSLSSEDRRARSRRPLATPHAPPTPKTGASNNQQRKRSRPSSQLGLLFCANRPHNIQCKIR
jgi:hypothetical protein